jgi:hypothetical protein
MGQPRKYTSAAEKMQAYRQRKALALAELRTKAEALAQSPKVLEKVVEKIVTGPAKRSSQKPTKSSHPAIWPTDRQRIMTEQFAHYHGGEDAAKRMGGNTKRAATAVLEIKKLLDSLPYEKRLGMAADMERLEQTVSVLNSYTDAFGVAQREAAFAREVRDHKHQREQAARVAATVLQLFGEAPDPRVITSMATDLVAFVTEIKSWARQQHGVDKALMDIDEFEIKQALHNRNVTILGKAVAKARLQLPLRGERHETKEGLWWHGGWEDFIAWRAEGNSV